MFSKRRIAVLIAGLFVGAQVGVAAVSDTIDDAALPPSAEQEYMEPAPVQAEYIEPAPAQTESVEAAQAQAESVEPASEQAQYMEPAPAQSEVTITSSNEPGKIRATLASIRAKILGPRGGDAFPALNSLDDTSMLPAQVAYFDRLEADRLARGIQWVANGDAFPRSNSVDDVSLLPAQIAHFDQRTDVRLAAAPSQRMGLRGIFRSSTPESSSQEFTDNTSLTESNPQSKD